MGVPSLQSLCLRSIVLELNLFEKLCSHGQFKDELLDSEKFEDIIDDHFGNNTVTTNYLQCKQLLKEMLYRDKKFDLTRKVIEGAIFEKVAPVLVVAGQSFVLYGEVFLPSYLSRLIWEEVNYLLFDIEFLCQGIMNSFEIETRNDEWPMQLHQLDGSIFYRLFANKMSLRSMVPFVHMSINEQFDFDSDDSSDNDDL